MSEREAVQCSVCHRALWRADADGAGRCVDCRPEAPPATKKAPPAHADARPDEEQA